jgi:hypothetical protein
VQRDLALLNARIRMAVGASLVLAPRLIGPMWIGDGADRPVVRMMSRALGARDLALGLGTAVALDRGTPVRGWLEGTALSDGGDLLGTLLAGDSIPRAKPWSDALWWRGRSTSPPGLSRPPRPGRPGTDARRRCCNPYGG